MNRSLTVCTLGLALIAALAIGGCGSSDGGASGTASCTLMQSFAGLSQEICEEGTGLSAAQEQQLMQECMLPGGGLGADAGASQQATFAMGPCPRANALGGCREVQGGMTVVAWYYQMPGFTSSDIQQLCAMAGLTFVAP